MRADSFLNNLERQRQKLQDTFAGNSARLHFRNKSWLLNLEFVDTYKVIQKLKCVIGVFTASVKRVRKTGVRHCCVLHKDGSPACSNLNSKD